MIDNYSIKKNNSYTYYKNSDASSPVDGDTLLSDVTELTFIRGYSYTYVTDTWIRQEADKDALIDDIKYSTLSMTLDYMNNHFYVDENSNFFNYDYVYKNFSFDSASSFE